MLNSSKFIGNILKKIFKKLLWFFVVFWLSFSVLHSNCYADNPTPSSADSTVQETENNVKKDLAEIAYLISTFCYALLWPVLVVVWMALDNSLVYWSFLNLDAILWSVWNIMKNFANFALWFMFLFSVVRNLISPLSASKSYEPKKVVTNTLVAWILIQMSWFLVAVLIDLSTILIYSVWWLPLSMMNMTNSEITSQPLLSYNIQLDQTDKKIEYGIYASYWDRNISECIVESNLPWLSWSYILWRSAKYLNNDKEFYSGYCLYSWMPYKYKEIDRSNVESWFNISLDSGYLVANAEYRANVVDYVKNSVNFSNVSWYIADCSFSSTTMINKDCVCLWYGAINETDPFYAWAIDTESSVRRTVNSLLEQSKWFVGPMITMYSSLLGYQDMVMSGSSWWISNLFNLIVTTFFAIVLFIPVLVFAVVLLMRIWMLWVIIALSPVLILVFVFKIWKDISFLKKFSLPEVLKMIFSPVIVVFAVSLSIIFLSAIQSAKPSRTGEILNNQQLLCSEESSSSTQSVVNESPLLDAFGIHPIPAEEWEDWDINSYSILWITTIKINTKKIDYDLDMFSWFIIMLLSTWIVWFFMKTALSLMWDTLMWKDSIWWKLMWNATELMKNLPVIPLPGGWAVWINAAEEVLHEAINRPLEKMKTNQTEALEKRFPWLTGVKSGDEWESETTTIIQNINNIINENKEATTTEIVWKISSEDKNKFEKLYSGVSLDRVVEWIKASSPDVVAQQLQTYSENKTKKVELPSSAHTNADAYMYTAQQINAQLNWDNSWTKWAESVVRWTVHTMDWIYEVQNTRTAQDPFYELVKYEDGNLAKIDQLEALRNSDKDEDKKSLEHLGKLINNLEKEMVSLNELKAKKERVGKLDEKDQQLFDLLSKYNKDLVDKNIKKYRDFNDGETWSTWTV